VFTSSKATLGRSPVLELLLAEEDEQRFGVERDTAGRIFLDRDPDLFARVLYFLRHGRVRTDSSGERIPELLQEFEYLQVDFDPSRLDTSPNYYARLTWNALHEFMTEFMAQVRPMLERAAKRGIPRLLVRLYRAREGKASECIMWQDPKLPCCSIHNDIWYFSAAERPDLWRQHIGFCNVILRAKQKPSPYDHVEFFFSWPLAHPFKDVLDAAGVVRGLSWWQLFVLGVALAVAGLYIIQVMF